ncbi:Metallo-dependent phosphatase-like protein [Mortierella sp. GBAus27b]|nr:hypothetical protein BGX31_010144 [Mortierella sp. GBA43]KAI8363321.1 Metallo-dependent phosphatase-like protein [Mortierella sp. GBAus27b]
MLTLSLTKSSLAVALLLSLCSVTRVDGAPHPRLGRRGVVDLDANVIGVLKVDQPDTPPTSLPSDPYANYTHEVVLRPDDFQTISNRRTIVIGDVHGNFDGLDNFLTKIQYNKNTDNIIFAGDMVAKGPKTSEVIDKAIELKARCVRGNHDDKVVRWKGYLNDPKKSKSVPSDLDPDSDHHKIAQALTDAQYKFMLSCPLILTLPKEISKINKVIHVIHAGVDPKVALNKQEPWVLVNIRNVLKDGTPSRKKKKGSPWADVYNASKPTDMVVYGHDAGRGLTIKPMSTGLDTGCVYGKELTGYIVETGKTVSFPCPDVGVGGDDE